MNSPNSKNTELTTVRVIENGKVNSSKVMAIIKTPIQMFIFEEYRPRRRASLLRLYLML